MRGIREKSSERPSCNNNTIGVVEHREALVSYPKCLETMAYRGWKVIMLLVMNRPIIVHSDRLPPHLGKLKNLIVPERS